MCGRYASSRKPEDLAEEFEIDRARLSRDRGRAAGARLQRRPHQGGLRRPGPPRAGRREPDRAAAARAALGAGAVLGQGPLDRQPDDQRPHGDRRPRSRPSGEPSPSGAACCPPTATTSGTPTEQRDQGRQAAQAAVLHPPRGRVGDGDGRALRDLEGPDPRRRRPRALPVDLHGADHEAEDAVGHIHDRMPLLVEPERYAEWLDPAATATEDPRAAGAGGARPAGGLPGLHLVNNVRNNGPELVEPLPGRGRARRRPGVPRRVRGRDRGPHLGDAARRRPAARRPGPAPRATLFLSTAPGAAPTPPTWSRLARALPRAGDHRDPARAALARRRAQRSPRPRRSSTRPSSPSSTGCGSRTPLVARRAQCRRPERRAAPPTTSAPPAVLALSFPLHPPGKPEKSPARRAARRAGARRWWSRASATRSGRPRSSPPAQPLVVVPAADHGLKVPSAAGRRRRRPDRGRGARGACIEADALEWSAGGRRESSGRPGVLAMLSRNARTPTGSSRSRCSCGPPMTAERR